jgi:hypothetical protein
MMQKHSPYREVNTRLVKVIIRELQDSILELLIEFNLAALIRVRTVMNVNIRFQPPRDWTLRSFLFFRTP